MDMLKKWVAAGTTIRRCIRYLGLKDTSQWDKPMEQQDTDSLTKILLVWACDNKGKKGTIQLRTYDTTKTKTYYIEMRRNKNKSSLSMYTEHIIMNHKFDICGYQLTFIEL